jgi:hypothetical protein
MLVVIAVLVKVVRVAQLRSSRGAVTRRARSEAEQAGPDA